MNSLPTCGICASIGWIPFDKSMTRTGAPMAIDMLVQCHVCNQDRHLPVPSEDVAKRLFRRIRR